MKKKPIIIGIILILVLVGIVYIYVQSRDPKSCDEINAAMNQASADFEAWKKGASDALERDMNALMTSDSYSDAEKERRQKLLMDDFYKESLPRAAKLRKREKHLEELLEDCR